MFLKISAGDPSRNFTTEFVGRDLWPATWKRRVPTVLLRRRGRGRRMRAAFIRKNNYRITRDRITQYAGAVCERAVGAKK